MRKDLFGKKKIYITTEDHRAMVKIKEAAEKLNELINSAHYQFSDGTSNVAELALAKRKLEECVMWTEKAATHKYFELDAYLKQQGFEEISKEERDKNFNALFVKKIS